MSILLILVSLGMVVLCGIFVAAEFSLITVNRSTVEKYAGQGDKQAQGVLRALKSLSTQLSGAQVGITLTSLAIGFLSEPTIARLLESPLGNVGLDGTGLTVVATILSISIATVITMVFGELIPKNLAIARPLETARTVQAAMRLFTTIAYGPIKLLNNNANYILKQLGQKPQEELASARSADELVSLVRRSAEKGTLPQDTARMLERSLAFGEQTALDVMTPRVRVHTVNYEEPVSAIIELAKRTGYSRFPVV